MMIACVALSPHVTGSRIEMPASGPMPGSTPTSVPTRQPRNAYHRLDGSNATAKPCHRLMRLCSTRLESDSLILNHAWPAFFALVHDLVGKPVSTFPDHVLESEGAGRDRALQHIHKCH